MKDILKELAKQPSWLIALLIGAILIAAPCITVDKDHRWVTHSPNTLVLVIAGGVVILVSFLALAINSWSARTASTDGLDLASVVESDGVQSVTVGGCEIRVMEGRIEESVYDSGTAIALPCNEYFDDLCARDSRSSLGAYVSRVFGAQSEKFVLLMKSEAKKKFGKGTERQKTDTEKGESFGEGRCLLLLNPLERLDPIALVSTTTQRAGEGLATQISCVFQGMHKLNECLADARITEVAMPVLGGGHGGIHPALAFMGLLLAVAEAARYGHGAQRLKKVTIVVFKKDRHTAAEVDLLTRRRALALINSHK